MPSFKVITDADGSYDNYADDDRRWFNRYGMLATIRASTGERRTYSAIGWRYIEDTETEKADDEIDVPDFVVHPF